MAKIFHGFTTPTTKPSSNKKESGSSETKTEKKPAKPKGSDE